MIAATRHRWLCLFAMAALAVFPLARPLHAQDGAEDKPKPIRALLITGGCCHDYEKQKKILSDGIAARSAVPVEWTIVHQGGSTTDTKIPVYENADWAKGYDVVVHNECFAGVKDTQWAERILKPHREGVGAVLIHCAMHSYRVPGKEWFHFCGVRSHGHGPHYAYTVENHAADDPIMTGFGDEWTVPKGELYDVEEAYEGVTVLAHAKRRKDDKPQVCVWRHDYGDGRVFGTTIGHYNETMADERYQQLITRGFLWAAKRYDEKLIKTPAQVEAERPVVMVPQNLAQGAKAEAQSEEANKGNVVAHALDGDESTRWCASNGNYPQWLRVDLGRAEKVAGVEIVWESSNNAYMYKLLGSAEGNDWRVLSDQSKGLAGGTHELDVKADGVRYLRLDITGSSAGGWASIREIRVHGDKLVPQSKAEADAARRATAGLAQKVKAPDAFDVTVFAAPPQVTYPACLTSTADGTVFVGVDPDGSLGKRKGFGKVMRLRDTDGDGAADEFVEFCQVDHPRGLIYESAGKKGGKLWVLHPPHLTLYVDTDGDGKADEEQRLVSDISTDQNAKRGADHTTNGIAMGIDGWIYIAVGDFGFANATGTDGRKLTLLGGGVVRVRPDGTGMELYAQGLRNIYDVAIDPYMNLFTRDNTNDGGNWNLRFSHIVQSGNYGYPRLFENFTGEILPALADHGGGSGCGAMYLHAPGQFPAPYDNCVLTCDWGTSKVYIHTPQPAGPTFTEDQDVFVQIPRPTDIDADATGQIFIASWNNGGFSYDGDNVGFIARVTPKGWKPAALPDLADPHTKLVDALASPSAALRLAAQRAILRRGAAMLPFVMKLAEDRDAPLYARVAAVFTAELLSGIEVEPALYQLAKSDASVREWALRAVSDDLEPRPEFRPAAFVDALDDHDPRVRVAAAVALGRHGVASEKLVAVAARGAKVDVKNHHTPAPDLVVPHVAVQALAATQAADACLAAIGTERQPGGLWALRYMHTDEAVNGLISRLASVDTATKRELLDVLARLYFREADYDGSWWWGTRPDRTGPYYKRVTWSASPRIGDALIAAAQGADADTRNALAESLREHKIELKGLDLGQPDVAAKDMKKDEPAVDVVAIAQAGKDAKAGIGAMGLEDVLVSIAKKKGDPKLGERLFTQQGCVACHTTKAGETLKGPHLGVIGSQYSRAELAASILRPGDIIAQGFATVQVTPKDGAPLIGFVSREAADEIDLRDIAGNVTTIKTADIAARTELPLSMMPPALASTLTVDQFASLLAYLESLK